MDMTERLYRGDYCTLDEGMPQTTEYLEAKQRRYAIYEELETKLAEPQQKLLEQFMDAMAEENDFVLLEFFRHGLRLGMALLAELYRT